MGRLHVRIPTVLFRQFFFLGGGFNVLLRVYVGL